MSIIISINLDEVWQSVLGLVVNAILQFSAGVRKGVYLELSILNSLPDVYKRVEPINYPEKNQKAHFVHLL